MWIDKIKMLNRAFFESILNRLSSLISVLKPRQKISTIPEVLHRVITQDFLNKFDEIVIIGDVHGCFDEFLLLLDQISLRKSTKIDHKRILKICAGDLVNKGPKSKEVLDYMINNADNCIAVRGNHDEVVMREYIKFIEKGEVAEKNSWVKQLNKNHLNYLTQLPYTINIPHLNLIVVHAGLVPNVDLDKQNFVNMTCMRNLIESSESGQTYQASTNLKEGNPWASIWKGPSHIYFGHDANRKLQEYSYATGLDTGAVYGGSLTGKFVMGPRNGDYLAVKALKVWKDPFQEKTA